MLATEEKTTQKENILSFLLEDGINKLNTSVSEKLETTKELLESKINELKRSTVCDMEKLAGLINSDLPMVVNLGTVEVPDKK